MRRPSPSPNPSPAPDAAAIANASVGLEPPQSAELVPAEGMPQHRPSAGAPDPNLALFMQAARDPQVDIAKLERLMALRKEVEEDSRKRAYFDAKARAKGEFPPILKTHLVDFEHRDGQGRTTYKHEDLFDITQVVDPILARHGLSYSHRVSQTGDKIRVTCIFAHADGYSEEFPLEGVADTSGKKSPNQAIASSITFMQRGTLKQALGLAAGRDNDGAADEPVDPTIEPDDVVYVETLLRDTESNLAIFLETIGAPAIAEMRVSQYKRAIALLNEKKRRAASGTAVG
jgi:ERF superfamily